MNAVKPVTPSDPEADAIEERTEDKVVPLRRRQTAASAPHVEDDDNNDPGPEAA